MKIKSRQDAVVLMMNELGVTVPQATEIFVKLVDAKSAKRPELLKQIREVEAMGVSAYNKLLRKVSNSFVTPFDREDLFRLGDALDDVIDEIICKLKELKKGTPPRPSLSKREGV